VLRKANLAMFPWFSSKLNMTNIRAGCLPASSLQKLPASALCSDYLGGFCRRGEKCLKVHEICAVAEADHQEVQGSGCLAGPTNYLLQGPRLLPLDKCVFDVNGPGNLSSHGVRHDNDHIDIRDIQILPTTDEILCRKLPYMPRKDDNTMHHLAPGQQRLMDINFRQLRYDNTEVIIDACYHACQSLVACASKPRAPDYDDRVQTPQGYQYHLYRDIGFESARFQENQGIHIRASFSCPEALRSRRIISSGRLESGMLVALVGWDEASGTLSTTFMIVDLCQSTDAMKPLTGDHSRGMCFLPYPLESFLTLKASVLLSFADKGDIDGVRRILYNMKGLLSEKFVLVEFPGVLLAGFLPILKQLQILSSEGDEIAFLSSIAHTVAGSSPTIALPTYAASEDFAFSLDVLHGKDQTNATSGLSLKPSTLLSDREQQEAFIKTLGVRTTLDGGQSTALCENLCRGLAFTQGPPGTGKTYLGVSLAKVLLASRRISPKPILCVTQTNHALDAYLHDLLNDGVTKIARLGRGSKEDWTAPYLVRELSRKMKLTQFERSKMSHGYLKVDSLAKEGNSFCESMNNLSMSWLAIRGHLQANYKSIFQRFSGLETVSDQLLSDIRLARKAGGFAYEYWCRGGDINDVEQLLVCFDTMLGDSQLPRELDTLKTRERVLATIAQNVERAKFDIDVTSGRDVWSLSLEERELLQKKWKDEICPWAIVDQTAEIHRRHLVAVSERKKIQEEIDARCLGQQEVIGLTTTACARDWSMLRQIDLEIVICEEAGEVMEAQTLCTLFPSVMHAIFIGDPLQLRPQISQPTLSLETTAGAPYRLDESLFERMMFPSAPGVLPLPTSQLNLQRRMHPEIADIMRATLYPNLQDHESTYQHPPVAGMTDRVWWFDHQQPEDRPDHGSPMSKSYSNSFEVEMICGLVQYLVNSNEYDFGDIAVLTPYNGQLAALTSRLSMTCSIMLSEKDRETLHGLGLLEESHRGSKTDVDMKTMLRLASIDSFQGEEAKIVILSTVRSNMDDRVGFLKTTNRINVGCSRARDGFYIIGNASLMKGVDMWRSIIELLTKKKKIGASIQTCCSRHTGRTYDLRSPQDFELIPSCQVPCDSKLPCGHQCKENCHAPSLHSRMACTNSCGKILEPCGHKCLKSCGESCGDCLQELDLTILKCGHQQSVTCSEVQTESQLLQKKVCRIVIDTVQLSCGHYQQQLCSTKDESLICENECESLLACGHRCPGLCSECKENAGHSACVAICGKEQSCGHSCAAPCHRGTCPPCLLPCQRSCVHGKCLQVCSRICDPCVKISSSTCEHPGSCTAICCLTYAQIPCNEPCSRLLLCGHPCTSLCGERCATTCTQCLTGEFSDHLQLFLSCGHSFDVQALDDYVGMGKIFEMNDAGIIERPRFGITENVTMIPRCPVCNKPCKDIRRYALMSHLRDLPENIDRLFKKLGRKMYGYMEQVLELKEELQLEFPDFQKSLKPGPLAGKKNENLVRVRVSKLNALQQQISKYRG